MVEPITGLTLEMSINYTTYTKISPMSLQTLELVETPLFDTQVQYKMTDVSGISEIHDKKDEMHSLTLITMGLAGLSMLLIIVFGVLLVRKRKSLRRTDIM